MQIAGITPTIAIASLLPCLPPATHMITRTCFGLISDIRRLRKVHVVDRVDDILRRDHLTAEVAPVEAADCVLAALHTVKLDVDLTVVVVQSEVDVDDLPVFVFAFGADVVF